MDLKRLPIAWLAIQKLWGEANASRDDDEFLGYARKNDWERNAETAPPTEEYIDLYCRWAVEFYTPTYIEGLVDGLQKLGASTETNQRLDRDPVDWLRRQRSLHRTSGWMSLGNLLPPGSKRFGLGDTIETSLPEGVKYATWKMFSLSPSLTCIVMAFVFDEQEATIFDASLRSEYQTYLEPVGKTNRIHTPDFQKAARIRSVRERISNSITQWFKENLPGLFCSDLLDGKLPTCELLFLTEADPFPVRQDGEVPPPQYLQLLGLDGAFEAWESTRTSGLKFKPFHRGARDGQHHSILSIKESAIPDSLVKLYGGERKPSMFSSLNMNFPDILSLWACISLLEGYTRHLGKIRDSASFRLATDRNTIAKLHSLGDNVSFSLDISAVTSDLIANAKAKSGSFGWIEKYKPCTPDMEEEQALNQVLLAAITEEAKQLRKMDRSIRTHLTQFGSLLAAAEDIRLQRKINKLTWTILAAALLAPFLTWLLSEYPDWWKNLRYFAEQVWPW